MITSRNMAFFLIASTVQVQIKSNADILSFLWLNCWNFNRFGTTQEQFRQGLGCLSSIKSWISWNVRCNRWLPVALDWKFSQEYQVKPQGICSIIGSITCSIISPSLFLSYINDLPENICNIAIYADDITLYC